MKIPIPVAAFEQHIIVLGKTRSGKSSAMRLLVEHLLEKSEPVCIIDPKGDWWGLKASADGKSAGYPVVIFGGEHRDVPLNSRSGASVAELVATGNRSAIIDLGGWMPGERTQFWIDFASTYFRAHKGRHYLVIDEVHNLAPKGKIIDPNAGKMLHWSNRLASEGLGKGISMLAASQRPQKVHNDFLTSCETLLAMRVIHKSDRDALKDWIDACGDPEKGKEVLNSVASLSRGEAWAYSPEYEFGPKRVQFPMFHTYDSFRPQRGGSDVKLKGWADVDLADVTKKLEATVKEAEANDPAKLKLRIAELQKQLRNQPAADAKEVKVADPRAIERAVRPLKQLLEEVMRVFVKVNAFGFEKTALSADQIQIALEKTAAEISRVAKAGIEKRSGEFERLKHETNRLLAKLQAALENENVTVNVDIKHNEPFTVKSSGGNSQIAQRERISVESGELTPYQVDILAGLALLEGIGRKESKRALVAAAAGKAVGSSTFERYTAKLKSDGLIEYGSGTIRLTDRGRAVAPISDEPLTNDELHKKVLGLFTPYQQSLVRALIKSHPEAMTREQLGEAAGQQSSSSTFERYVAALKSAEVIEYPDKGHVKAADWLFLD